MRTYSRWAMTAAVAAAVVVSAVSIAHAQVNPRDVPIVSQPQQRFDGGQDIQPIFEGWTRLDDGSYLFHFGYLNRNYREQPSIPVGPNNYVSPGAEDRGQPTHFYPRTQRYQFTAPMPADTGPNPEDGIIWTVTAHGSEQRAYGWLQPEWEIDENTITSNSRTGFGRPLEQLFANLPPEVDVSASAETVGVGEPLTLTAAIRDDELPTELPARPPRTRLPTLTPPEGTPQVPDNVRWYQKPRPAAQRPVAALDRPSRPSRRRLRAGRLPALGRGEGVRARGGRRSDRPDLVGHSGDPHRRRRLDVRYVRDDRHIRLARHVYAPGLGVGRDVPDAWRPDRNRAVARRRSSRRPPVPAVSGARARRAAAGSRPRPGTRRRRG